MVKRNQIRVDRAPNAPFVQTPDDPLRRTEKALRLVYGVVLPRMHRNSLRGPGLARPGWQNAFVLNNAVFVQLAQELGESWMALVRNAEAPEYTARRVERRHMEDAAEEIVATVERLPKPLRDVTVRRAAGLSWRKICQALPKRAPFSIEDDWKHSCCRVWDESSEAVCRLI